MDEAVNLEGQVTDFNPADIDSEGWNAHFPAMVRTCPVFKSTGMGGYWVAAGHPELTAMLRDWETFSSAKHWEKEGDVPTGGSVVPPVPARAFIPVETDPPVWKKYRHLLNSFFAPKAALSYKAMITEVATALIDRVIETGEIDITRDFTNPLTALSTLKILGIDYKEDEWRRWSLPFHQLAYARGLPEFEQCLADLEWIRGQLGEAVDLNRAEQQPGLFGILCHADTVDGKLSKQELIDIGMMIQVGGVGTTTALFSNTMVYLSKDLEARRRLLAEPEMLDIAKEEFVRFFSPISSQARTVTHDTEVFGAHMKAGEQVLMAYGAANRDERVFADPDKVILDRMPNPHVGFGGGIHRCLGSFLARVFFEVMFHETFARMPDIMVDHDRVQPFPCVTSVNGLISVPATFTPGRKTGTGALA